MKYLKNGIQMLFAMGLAAFATAAPDRFAVPITDLIIPLGTNCLIAKVQPMAEYQLLKETQRSYLVLVEISSNKTIGLIPKSDYMGNATGNLNRDKVEILSIVNVGIYTGYVPFDLGKRYRITSESSNTYQVEYAVHGFTTNVAVAKTNCTVLQIDGQATEIDATQTPSKGTIFKTRSGKTLFNVIVNREEPDGLSLIHSIGIEKVSFEDLSDEVKKQYHYDPEKAREYVEQQDALRRKAEEAAAARRLMLANTEKYTGVILQVLDGGALMMNYEIYHYYIERGRSWHGKSTDTEPVFIEGNFKGSVDKSEWSGRVYPLGTYSYEAVSGGTKTIKRYKIAE